MGKVQTKLKGLEIEKQPIETTDFWSLFNAEIVNREEDAATKLSIFHGGEVVVNGENPLERATKNFMIYRHPNILKYVASWQEGAQHFLATEQCRPLSQIIHTQNDIIQICLGLKNILKSLVFLVEQADARHLNLCICSIYTSVDGGWRLAGFEHVWKSKEVDASLLKKSKSFRYANAIDENEKVNNLEQFAFAVLCEELLKNSGKTGGAGASPPPPYTTEFLEYCETYLRHKEVGMRPKLSAVLLHPFFNHEFMLIHSFLEKLPLKTPQERQDFFTGLIDRLRYFDETVVANQLGSLLLSRMVLLDTTAQLCVTPYVLRIKSELTSALFSGEHFKIFIIPKIMQIFMVRDAQIRLILLEYFPEYMKLMTKLELQEQILPNLLLGIKDTNDVIVGKTLRCLADLIPMLGSAAVIGGNRRRIFSDGRPQRLPSVSHNTQATTHWIEPRSITPMMTSDEFIASASPLPDMLDLSDETTINGEQDEMPERPSPVGGEDVQETAATTEEFGDEDEAWSDWDNDETKVRKLEQQEKDESDFLISEILDKSLKKNTSPTNVSLVQQPQLGETVQEEQQRIAMSKRFIIEDITELDIKNKKFAPRGSNTAAAEEFDFFKDMEPVIGRTSSPLKIHTETDKNDYNSHASLKVDSSSLTLVALVNCDDSTAEGWDDGSNEW